MDEAFLLFSRDCVVFVARSHPVISLSAEYVTCDREREKEKEKEKSERIPTSTEQLHAVSEAINSGVFNGSATGSGSSGSSGASQQQHQSSSTDTPNEKSWNYSALDLISGGAAFWQNYPGKSSIHLILKAARTLRPYVGWLFSFHSKARKQFMISPRRKIGSRKGMNTLRANCNVLSCSVLNYKFLNDTVYCKWNFHPSCMHNK